jgi:MarR family 2-MHQ and catechol resistance regulon transcriptional repressor
VFGVDDAAVAASVRTFVKLMRASRAVQARTETLLTEAGLTSTQLGVLEAILHKGPMTQRELGRKVLTSPGNMTDVIDKLERRGLVCRGPAASDRRLVLVTLTEAGTALIEGVFPRHAANIARAMAGLSAAELDVLDGLLRRLGMAAAQASCNTDAAP